MSHFLPLSLLAAHSSIVKTRLFGPESHTRQARPADLKSIFLAQVISGHMMRICSETPTCVIAGGDGIGGGAALISY